MSDTAKLLEQLQTWRKREHARIDRDYWVALERALRDGRLDITQFSPQLLLDPSTPEGRQAIMALADNPQLPRWVLAGHQEVVAVLLQEMLAALAEVITEHCGPGEKNRPCRWDLIRLFFRASGTEPHLPDFQAAARLATRPEDPSPEESHAYLRMANYFNRSKDGWQIEPIQVLRPGEPPVATAARTLAGARAVWAKIGLQNITPRDNPFYQVGF
jgi:hypothetical protein